MTRFLLWSSCALFALGCTKVHVGSHDGGAGADAGSAIDGGGAREPCGRVTCDPGLVCCNASCGICTLPDQGCPAIACVNDCASNADCASDEYCAYEGSCPPVCAIPEGCPGTPRDGVCTPRPTACAEIAAPACGCDGVTYDNGCSAAGNGVNVEHDGPCESPPPPECAAQDAAGEGGCAALIGYRWDGERCETLGGCSCAGPDCENIYSLDELEACERDHASCASCGAMDAAGVGDCDGFYGYAWDGSSCYPLNGCECVGADCGRARWERELCEIAHAHCASGGSCVSDADCGGDQYCHYEPGACAGSGDGLGECRAIPPESACTLEQPPVCGCDGVTYGCEADANASGVSVLHSGACTSACAAQDARAEGACFLILGVRWTGSTCEQLGGCSCEGADCGALYETDAECRAAHEGCERAPGGACGGEAGDVCRPDEWCDFEDPHVCGGDDGSGVCAPRPLGCTDIDDPACGCDGETYPNACDAQAAGQDSHPGAC